MSARYRFSWVPVVVGLCASAPLVHGCAADTGTTSIAPTTGSDAAVTHEQPRAPALEVALVGHDGSPLARAQVEIFRHGFMKPVETLELEGQSATVELAEPGLYDVRVSAVDHRGLWLRPHISGPARIEGRLGTYERDPIEEEVGITARWVTGDEVGQPFTGQAVREGGVHVLKLEPPKGVTALQYQVNSLARGRTFNGPLAQRWVYDGGGDYWSEVDWSDGVSLELDLSQLPPSAVEESIEFSGAELPVDEQLAETIDPIREVAMATFGAKREESDTEGCRRAIRHALEKLEKQRAEIPEGALRQAHAMQSALLGAFFILREESYLDPGSVDFVMDEVEPSSLLWARAGSHASGLLAELMKTERGRRYVDQLVAAQTEPSGVVAGVYAQLQHADARGRSDEANALFRTLESQFGEMNAARSAKALYDPNRPIQVGRKMPEWSFARLDGKAPPVSSESLAGTPYLLDVWATWCGPCVAEMPSIHDEYAHFNGTKLRETKTGRRMKPAEKPRVEFVSLSIDGGTDVVDDFRSGQWPMPWVSLHVGEMGSNGLFETWQFNWVPFMVLVDAEGTIVATGTKLRGKQLHETLAAHVGEG